MIGVLRNLLHPVRHYDGELDDLVVATVKAEVKQAKLGEYRQGLSDGIVLFGKLALGVGVYQARPYAGPQLPDEFIAWARDAVARAEEDGGTLQ